MVYKKYIKKKVNGKTKLFGPYYYESYRSKNGEVKTRYVSGPVNSENGSRDEPEKKQRKLISPRNFNIILACFLGLIIVLFSIGFILDFSFSETLSGVSSFASSFSGGVNNLVGRVIEESNSSVSEGITEENISQEQVVEIGVLEENFTEEQSFNQAINETVINETSNPTASESIINESISLMEKIELRVETRQYKAVIGKPVKWVKKINLDNLQNKSITLELPRLAENITIKTDEEVGDIEKSVQEYETKVDGADRNSLITGQVSLELKTKTPGILTRLWVWLISGGVTGRVVSEEETESKITEGESSKKITLTEIAEETESEIAVEYYTESPQALEESISNGKRVTILGPEEVHYEDILAYSLLDNTLSLSDEGKIKVYWINNGKREQVERVVLDLDEDGNIDYVEWQVVSLSEQVYEIIYITKAIHLDEDRSFISEVYEQVKSKDGEYSLILDGEYIRVVFERPLDKTKDITIYARAKNTSAEVAVYREGDNKEIARFEGVDNENWYKIYLSNLNDGETEDTFDLKSIGKVEYDYVVDPVAYDVGSNVSKCGIIDASGVYHMNNSITNNSIKTGEPCINITSPGVSLDCRGFFIKSDDNEVGIYSNASNTTLLNCNVSMGSENGGIGVKLAGANSSVLRNLSLNSNFIGVYFIGGNTSFLENSTLSNNQYGVYFRNSNKNNFSSVLISNSILFDVNVSLSTETLFLNVTYNSSKETVDEFSGLTRKWYYKAYVNNTDMSAASGANVSVYACGQAVNLSVGASGWTNRTSFIEYYYEGSKSFYPPCSFYAYNKSANPSIDYISRAHTIVWTNSTNVLRDNFTLEGMKVAACGGLNQSNKTYLVTKNIAYGGKNCITFNNSNITLDCQNYLISTTATFQLSKGIYSNKSYSTIQNCRLDIEAGNPGGFSLYLSTAADNSHISGITSSDSSNGVYISGCSNCFVSDITLSNNYDYGFYFSGSNSTVVNVSATSPWGILLDRGGIYLSATDSTFRSIKAFKIGTAGSGGVGIRVGGRNITLEGINSSSSGYGVYFQGDDSNITNLTASSNTYEGVRIYGNSNNNVLKNLVLSGNLVYGINITKGMNNTIIDSNLDVPNLNWNRAIYLKNAPNTSIVNSTYYHSYPYEDFVKSNASLIRKWYYRAYVNDTKGTEVANVNVTVFNRTGDYMFNLTTNATGDTPRTTIIDYINLEGTTTFYSNYSVNASNLTSSFTTSLNTSFDQGRYYRPTSNFDYLIFDYHYFDISKPVITLVAPPSGGKGAGDKYVDYQFNVSDHSNIANCSLIVDGVPFLNTTFMNRSRVNTIEHLTDFGAHTWGVNCTDIHNFQANSSINSLALVSVPTQEDNPGGGGSSGSGSTIIKSVILKVDLPDTLPAYEKGRFKIPVTLSNPGQVDLKDVSVRVVITRGDVEIEGVSYVIDKDYFSLIKIGENLETFITLDLDLESVEGLKVNILADSQTPKYSFSGSLYLTTIGTDYSGVQKMIVFTDNMIVENPECLELQELMDAAQQSFNNGELEKAFAEAEQVVAACKSHISQSSKPVSPIQPTEDNKMLLIYLLIGVGAAVLFGIAFNLYKLILFKRKNKA